MGSVDFHAYLDERENCLDNAVDVEGRRMHRRMAARGLILASLLLIFAAARDETWCWSPDDMTRGVCVYNLRQCQEIVRLRRAGFCHRSTYG